ncbi:MAG: 30S ribosomal protein S8e [Methanomicrobiales archaeon]|jgi:small subunit ribosomal protein S8e|nr:30S ribosomal protein S8e [Methanomicrobiales archaeon]
MHWHGRSIRKSTGGRYHPARGKRRAEIGSPSADTHIGAARRKFSRRFGGNIKVRALREEYASVAKCSTGEVVRAKIEKVEQNVANPNYVRRNLLTKGAVIRTDIGRARISSRPGQDGVINAVLIE